MPRPFKGVVYVQDSPTTQCRRVGDGTRTLRLDIPRRSCGIQISENEDGELLYEVLLYVQYDKLVQQAVDEVVAVKCAPQRQIVVRGSMRHHVSDAASHLPNDNYKHEEITNDVDSWMDILQGSMPFVKPVTGYVNVGEEMTMVIKIRHTGVETKSRVTECVAHDGSQELLQELTDDHGCSLDTSILPELTEVLNPVTGFKVFYATFKAFKFPDRDHLHLQCKVLICNKTCPIPSCNAESTTERYIRSLHRKDGILNKLDVSKSFEVKTVVVEQYGTPLADRATAMDFSQQVCLSFSRMILILAVTAVILTSSLVISICMCVRARQWRRRFAAHRDTAMRIHGFPYGGVVDM
ncbi:uncharacterized protein LOC135397805 [Ornithodoros turicata]|uniref:uncharacterized protein LOC135397805 n=1 Tax=Ornithodoros turicata TaxID=34597 RepID=UPI00313908DD